MGNYESSLGNNMDPEMDSDTSEEEYFINLFDDQYEEQDDYFLNFLLQRFANRWVSHNHIISFTWLYR